jgi:hypothetical protein
MVVRKGLEAFKIENAACFKENYLNQGSPNGGFLDEFPREEKRS